MRSYLQHHLNVVHLYCRLVSLGLSRAKSRRIAARIEKNYFYKKLYKKA